MVTWSTCQWATFHTIYVWPVTHFNKCLILNGCNNTKFRVMVTQTCYDLESFCDRGNIRGNLPYNTLKKDTFKMLVNHGLNCLLVMHHLNIYRGITFMRLCGNSQIHNLMDAVQNTKENAFKTAFCISMPWLKRLLIAHQPNQTQRCS